MTESFLDTAFVLLLAAVASVPIAKRLGLGSVLGYLIAGVLIGPYVFGFIDRPEDIMHFAEFGVVMMLFLIGLELQPSRLWNMRGPILGSGGLQVLGTSILLTLIAMAFGLSPTLAAAIGMTGALSSTAIVLQTLGEKRLLRTPGGTSAFSVLLFQDIAVIPMLAIFPLLAPSGIGTEGETMVSGWWRALTIAALVGAIIIAGKFLVTPVFRLIAESRLRELFTATALLLVVAVALAMQACGLSPALGTFLAGVVLAENEYRHELEADVEPFKGLLLGLFFISVGAHIDFQLLADNLVLVLSLVGLLLLVKMGVLYQVGRFAKLRRNDRLLFTLALAQGGEFGFVLLGLMLNLRLLDASLSALLILVVAMSMLLTPLFFLLYERLLLVHLGKRYNPPEPDTITDDGNPVIIAGFGRFGQVVGRLLHANDIGTTVLEHDATQLETLRKYGFKVYFGDAERIDLLESAGLAHAKLLVITLDDQQKVNAVVSMVRRQYPELPILARARNRQHAQELESYRAIAVFRETFGSSLDMAVMALRRMGFSAHRAHRAGQIFRRHDEQTLREQSKYANDETSYISYSRQARQMLSDLLAREMHIQDEMEDRAWDHPKTPEEEARHPADSHTE